MVTTTLYTEHKYKTQHATISKILLSSISYTEISQFKWINEALIYGFHDWEYRYASVGHSYLKRKGPHNVSKDLVTVFLCIQISIDKMQLCSLSVAYACPYHNPTTNMGHSVHNVDISTPHTHMKPCTAKFSKMMLRRFMLFSGNSCGGHSCSQHANSTLPQNLRHRWHCVVWQKCSQYKGQL